MKTATFETNRGTITAELYDKEAPKTVENFEKLANSEFYDGVKFHRVIADFVVQGGDPLSRDLPDGDAITAALVAAGLRIEARGTVRLPWLEEEMLAHFRDDADGFPRQAAFWSRTGWSQYIVVERR